MSVYDIITDQMVKALESGNAPWRRPWRTGSTGPQNIDGRPYRGMNVFLLLAQGYDSPYWMTLRQMKERGGQIRKGEHYTPVIFWKIMHNEDKTTGKKTTVPLLRFYKVWNLEQVDGINAPIRDVLDFHPIEKAEKVVAGYPNAPRIVHFGNSAQYLPVPDEIRMPTREQFTSEDEYYSALFHEMTHSTGHKSRLDRHTENDQFVFASHSYGREELVAEMGSALLCGETGILPQTMDNSAAYLRSWLHTIKEDSHAVVVAAGRAQKAVDYILDRPVPDYEHGAEE